ncbi:MAG: hypothetical protein H9W81_07630 [Enterococcus sp.]|nr:hypothetical protein [Enterococcus sp.]
MSKNCILAVIVVLIIAALGFGAVKTFDTSAVSYTDCVVTDTNTQFRTAKQGGAKHYIQTENCGNLKATKHAMESVEEGGTYDFTATGAFTWMKTVTEVTAK